MMLRIGSSNLKMTTGAIMSIYKRGDKWGVDKVFPDGLRKKRIIGNKKQAREVERNWDKLIIEQKWHILFVREIRFKDFLKDYFGQDYQTSYLYLAHRGSGYSTSILAQPALNPTFGKGFE
ncbi:hypothetical protein LCGC14_2502920, partial [marine sediment metagenome]